MSTVAIEKVPTFDRNFEGFLNYLSSDEAPTILSPHRFSMVFSVDLQTLASSAHVHRNTITRAPASEGIQRYLRDAVRVLRISADVSGNVEKALFWFKNNPLPVFDYKTAQTLVSEGRTDDVVRYLQSLEAGFSG